MSKEVRIVQLSPQDRTLLRRIADALDPVTEPKSGPRRLREPIGNVHPDGFRVPDEMVDRLGLSALAKLASANGDDRVALTAEDVSRVADNLDEEWTKPVDGIQYLKSFVEGSNGEHLDVGYTKLALRSGNARIVEDK